MDGWGGWRLERDTYHDDGGLVQGTGDRGLGCISNLREAKPGHYYLSALGNMHFYFR